MDQERFDRITRTLASGQSRRGVLKGLTGTAIGSLLAAVGAGEVAAKGPCRAPNTKCGKGKNAQCCTSGQICTDGGCVTQTRFVVLTWNPSPYPTHCLPTVSVTGFAPGTYTGSISSFTEVFTIVVADGATTGSWTTGDLYTINPGSYVATVDGVPSTATSLTCPAT